MIDRNVRIDYGKLRNFVVLDRQLNGNFGKLKQIIETGETRAIIADSFPVAGLNDPDNFLSLLFYFGLLTHDRLEAGETCLKVPNQTIRELMYEYMRKAYDDVDLFKVPFQTLSHLIAAMAWRGEWEAVFRFLATEIEKQTTIRDYLEGEKVVQGFLLAYLNVTDHYIIRPEYELHKGYGDFFFDPFVKKYPDMKYSYLVELKYITRGEYSEELKKEKAADARDQLLRYHGDAYFQARLGTTELKGVVLVFSGWELVHAEECPLP
jgi:hypothetical protein